MKASEIRVLLVEDNEDDYVRTRWQLAEIAEGRYQLEWVSDYQQGLEVLGRGQHDVCLVDHYLGGRVGLDFLREPAVTSSRVPILILTGSSDRQLDLDSMRSGAADFLV